MSPFESLLIVIWAEPRWMWQRFRGNWQVSAGVLRSTRRRFSDGRCRTVGVATNGMRTSHHIANTIIEHRMMKPGCASTSTMTRITTA